jgi:hypothetical protein
MLINKLRRIPVVLGDPRWWPFYVQRRFMQPKSREGLSNWVASMRPDSRIKVPDQADVAHHVQTLKTTGISHLGQIFTPEQSRELREYFSTKLVADPYKDATRKYMPDSQERDPDSHIAHHCAKDILNAPYLLDLVNDPRLLNIAAGFLGCKPTIGYMATWWSYHTAKGAQQAEHHHRDVDDWRFLKLFIYLTDVGQSNGPHIYVQNSSTSPKLREIRRFSDDEVAQAFGKENILELKGKAGEGFFEDTFGIHKGQPVAEGRRLLFQVVYSMFPLPYGPKEPVARISELSSERTAIDPWINRVYLQR